MDEVSTQNITCIRMYIFLFKFTNIYFSANAFPNCIAFYVSIKPASN